MMGGFLGNLLAHSAPSDMPQGERRAKWWEVIDLPKTNAGVSVTMDSALTMAAVFACIRILAEDIAKLPLHIYKRRKDGGKDRATGHYLYPLLHDAPNSEMTSYSWRESQQAWLGSWGNAYSQIITDGAGRVREIYPLRAEWMTPKREKGILYYEYRTGGIGPVKNYSAEEILHVHGFGFDGVQGYSPIRLARQTIGLGMAAEGFGSRFFANDARPGFVLEHPGQLGPEAYKNLKEETEKYEGVANAYKPRILEEGMTLHEIGVPPEDAQFLQTRKFQVNEVARWYRIPPHKIQDLERSTNNNIEHQSIEFVVDSLMPWVTRWEQAISLKLLTDRERRQGYFAAFLVDGLLRGDMKSRYEAYAMGKQWGWFSTDDIREMENKNPLPNGQGKMYMVPLNMVPADSLGSVSKDDQAARAIGGRLNAPAVQKRAQAAASGRHKLIGAYLPVFRDTAKRVVRAEAREIRKMAVNILPRGTVGEFIEWLNEYYEKHADFTAAQFEPVLMAYSEMVNDAVAQEGHDVEAKENIERFMHAYAARLGGRHVGRNLYALQSKLEAAQRAELDPMAAVEDQLDHWLETQPDSMAIEESARSNNALAVMLYGMVGVIYLRSVAIGKSCPFCTALDGRIIGIDEYFLVAGDEFQPEGAESPMRVNKSKKHGPYHSGCDCMVVAG